VSGSGKSTLVNDILAAQAARKLNGAKTLPGKHRHIENLDFFEKLVQVDQEPIGRSPPLEPGELRRPPAAVARPLCPGAAGKVRRYKPSHFSSYVAAASRALPGDGG